MSYKININGKDIAELGLTPLFGTLDNILKPAPLKKLVTNTNSTIDGVMPVNAASRKVDKRDFSMLFRLQSASDIDLYRMRVKLEEFLRNGVTDGTDKSGINEICFVRYEVCLRAIFNKIDKYQGATPHSGVASISVNFTEIDPTNRDMKTSQWWQKMHGSSAL